MSDSNEPTKPTAGDPTLPAPTPATSDGSEPTLMPGGPTLPIPAGIVPGKVMGGYRIDAELGAGGMGMVFKATQLKLKREVALKVMRPEVARQPGFADRFLREAQAAAKVHHSNVVTIFDADECDDVLFMAFEFVAGGDLGDRIKQQGALLPTDAFELMAACADGLQAVHEAGLVHRDIKPQNIFLDERGRPKLGDLGLARSAAGDDRLTMTGVGIGTPAYMSPEQAEGVTDIDIRSDIHALGATLYTMLTARPPFHGATPFSVTKQVMDGERPRVRDTRPDMPEVIERVVQRAMALDREQRYPDPQAFADDLRYVLQALPELPQPLPVQQDAVTLAMNDTVPTSEAQATGVTAVTAGESPGRSSLVWLWLLAIPVLGIAAWFAWQRFRLQPEHPTPVLVNAAKPAEPTAASAGPAAAPDTVVLAGDPAVAPAEPAAEAAEDPVAASAELSAEPTAVAPASTAESAIETFVPVAIPGPSADETPDEVAPAASTVPEPTVEPEAAASEADPMPASLAEPDPKPESDPAPVVEPDPKPESDPASVADAEPAPEPSAEPERRPSLVQQGTVLAIRQTDSGQEYLALDFGQEKGVEQGDEFRIRRDGQDIARVRAVVVKAGLTAAFIVSGSGYQPGDAVFEVNE